MRALTIIAMLLSSILVGGIVTWLAGASIGTSAIIIYLFVFVAVYSLKKGVIKKHKFKSIKIELGEGKGFIIPLKDSINDSVKLSSDLVPVKNRRVI